MAHPAGITPTGSFKPQAGPNQPIKAVEPLHTPTTPKQDETTDNFPVSALNAPGDLPSLGKPSKYKKGYNITYRPYSFGEIKKFGQSTGLSVYDRLMMLTKGVEVSFGSPLDLTLQDFLYICFLRKLSTMGSSQFMLDVTCPHCEKKQTKTLQFDDIVFDEISAPALPAVVSINGKALHIEPLTLGNYFTAFKEGFVEKPPMKHPDGSIMLDSDGNPLRDPDDEVALMALQVINMDFEDAYQVVDNAVGNESYILQSLDNYFFHGVKPHRTICNNKECGGEMSVSIDAKDTLIYPFRERKDFIRDSIQFGV